MRKGQASTGHAQRITRVWLRVLWGVRLARKVGSLKPLCKPKPLDLIRCL